MVDRDLLADMALNVKLDCPEEAPHAAHTGLGGSVGLAVVLG
jgi:hypothetical protein